MFLLVQYILDDMITVIPAVRKFPIPGLLVKFPWRQMM